MIDVDLYAVFLKVAPTGRHQFDVDRDGWWLTRDGVRCHDNPWAPQDEVDALIAATLLHMLNETGPIPIPADFQSRTIPEARLRQNLMIAAYSLYMRKLRRRMGPPRP